MRERRKLGLGLATVVVAGNTIGSGIFLLPATLAPLGGLSLLGWGLATLGALGFFMPLLINTVLLFGTVKFFAWEKLPRFIPKSEGDKDTKKEARPLFAIDGIFTTLWLALILTAAHGVLWFALDYIPSR